MNIVIYIGRIVARILFKLALVTIQILWRLPRNVIVWTPIAFAALRRACIYPLRLRAAAADTVRCPRCGLEQSLLGRWVCPVCHGIEATHAFAACRICGTQVPAGYVRCEDPDCRSAIPNPMLGGGP